MNYDVVVIGSGMSGLMAAAKAVSRKKSTLVITKGQGALPLTSGCIDFWGYELDNPTVPVSNPYEEIGKLASRKPEHPYAKALDVLVDSTDFLKEVLQFSGCSLAGSITENQKVLTALGTERISALVPPSMLIRNSQDIKKIIAVGFKNYTDFFPQMFLDNLSKTSFPEAVKIPLIIDLEIGEAIRSSHLSLMLERENVLATIIDELREKLLAQGVKIPAHYDNSVLFVFPAVLGRSQNSKIWERLTYSLAAQVIEVPGLPPSIPGQRLYNALIVYLRHRGAEIRYNSEVIDFTNENGKISSLTVQDSSNTTHTIRGSSVILATGSFTGGGLVAKKASLVEPIFKLPVMIPEQQQENTRFLSLEGHGFLNAGLEVDNQLRPLRNINNLYAVGSILAHSNYAAEKSGLGVALATGYKAGCLS